MFRSYGGPTHRNVTSPRDRKMTSQHYSARRTPLPSPTADPAPEALLTRSQFPTLSRQFIATIGTFEATRFYALVSPNCRVIIKVTKLSWFSCNSKSHPMVWLCRYRGTADVQLRTMLNPALENGGRSTPRSRRFTPNPTPTPTPTPTPQKRPCTDHIGSWVGLGARMYTIKDLAFTRVRFPKRPARSE